MNGLSNCPLPCYALLARVFSVVLNGSPEPFCLLSIAYLKGRLLGFQFSLSFSDMSLGAVSSGHTSRWKLVALPASRILSLRLLQKDCGPRD